MLVKLVPFSETVSCGLSLMAPSRIPLPDTERKYELPLNRGSRAGCQVRVSADENKTGVGVGTEPFKPAAQNLPAAKEIHRKIRLVVTTTGLQLAPSVETST